MYRTREEVIAGEAEAFRCFSRWCAEHDPDGEMEILDAAMAYAAWAETNSIAKYLDSAQPVRADITSELEK